MVKQIRNFKRVAISLKEDYLGKVKYKKGMTNKEVIRKAVTSAGKSEYSKNLSREDIIKVYNSIYNKSELLYQYIKEQLNIYTTYNEKDDYFLKVEDKDKKAKGIIKKGYLESDIIVIQEVIWMNQNNKYAYTYIVPNKYITANNRGIEYKFEKYLPKGADRQKRLIRVIAIEDILGTDIVKKEFKSVCKDYDSLNKGGILDGVFSLFLDKSLSNSKSFKSFRFGSQFEQIQEQIEDMLARVLINKSREYIFKKAQYLYEKDKYISEKGSKAKTYEDKKNNSKERIRLARNNKMVDSKLFKYIEFDDDMRVEDIPNIDENFKEIFNYIPNLKQNDIEKPILRYRKLGHLNASGVFYPHNNTIAVDIRQVGSFMHEYGHFIDYNHDKVTDTETLSLQKEFSDILKLYTVIYKSFDSKYKKEGKYNDDYYLTPTEVFARAFELYQFKKIPFENTFLNTASRYSNEYCYMPFKNKQLFDLVEDYFNRLLN